MTSRDFAFWLQGFFEIENPSSIDATKTELIKKHLNLVFKHEIDPSMGDEKHQAELNEIHHKPTLAELGEKHGFEVKDYDNKFGPKPSPKHKMGVHGWYNPNEGLLRC